VIRLLRSGLRPYRRLIVLVVVLVFVQVLTNLYLPTLNADIIDFGVIDNEVCHYEVFRRNIIGLRWIEISMIPGASEDTGVPGLKRLMSRYDNSRSTITGSIIPQYSSRGF